MSNTVKLRPTEFAHIAIESKIQKGSVVIDATLGNGYDTLFLYNIVGNEGKVFSFDIQVQSLQNTEALLQKHNLQHSSITLIHDGHENIKKYVNERIDAAMFNLGYLPKGNKDIITKPDTTIKAISTVLELLNRGGIISIVIYYGHKGGIHEKNCVLDYIETLTYEEYTVLQCDYINHENNPPVVLLIEKK
ncbi:MAG: class I SAM-dependent methyltransferase [Clostridiaceae bacterium]|nr:class I SAM-dependent methyltransferase [Clostridiaceae bacterium]